jgi:hypothetical protein
MKSQRADIVRVVESYVNEFGNRDLSTVPFAPDFTFESPLLPALVGQPRLVGEPAIEFLRGRFPLVKGTHQTRQLSLPKSPDQTGRMASMRSRPFLR